MKNFFTLLLVGLFATSLSFGQTTIFEDDFEGFTVGDYVSTDANWSTWSGGTGTSEDATISDEFNNTAAGANSMKVIADNDIIYSCGDKTSGAYQVKFWYYIPTGQGGYFNVQHDFGNTWAFSVEFHDGGTGFLHVNDANHDFTYTQDVWVEVVMDIDLDADNIVLNIGGTEIHDWAFSQEESGGAPDITLDCINFYGYPDVTPPYYVDDFEFIETVSGVDQAELELSATEFTTNGTANEVLTLSNTGGEVLTFEALVYYDAPVVKNAPVTNNVTAQAATKVVSLNMTSAQLDNPIQVDFAKDGSLTHIASDIGGSLGWGGDDNVTAHAAALFKYDNNTTAGVDVKDFIGMEITSVVIMNGDLPVDGSTQVEIFEGRDGYTNGPIGSAVTTETFTPASASSQSNVTLTTPVYVTGKDLFVGWVFTQLPGEHCVAMDAGPPSAGANWTKTGVAWSEVTEPTFGNFGIVATLTGDAIHQWLTLDMTQGTVAIDGTQDITLQFDLTDMLEGDYSSTVVIKTNDNDDDEAYNEIPVNLSIVGGIAGADQVSIASYPNPTHDFLNVVSSEVINEISIVSINGQLVNTIQPNSTSYQVETSNLDAGTYIFKITTASQTTTRKVIVE